MAHPSTTPETAATLAAGRLLARMALDLFNSVADEGRPRWSAYERLYFEEGETHDTLGDSLGPVCDRLERALDALGGPGQASWEEVQAILTVTVEAAQARAGAEAPSQLLSPT